VLERENIHADIAVGCSGGCIYTGFHALGWNLDELTRINTVIWEKALNQVSYRSLMSVVLPGVFGYSEHRGIIDDSHINSVLKTTCGDKTFADTRIPFFVIATDLKTGREVIISEGRIADAVRASVAIPLLLPPWEVNGQLLMDGGLCDPLPISVAIREGCDIILAMGFDNPPITGIPGFAKHVEHLINTFTNSLLKSTFAFYNIAHHAEVIPMIPTFDRSIGLDDLHLLPYIMEAGEKAAEEQMPYLKKLIEAMGS
jgi:NTE family protein